MKLPGVRGKIEEEMRTLGETLESNFYKDIQAVGYTISLPEHGMSGEEVLEAIQAQVNLGKNSFFSFRKLKGSCFPETFLRQRSAVQDTRMMIGYATENLS